MTEITSDENCLAFAINDNVCIRLESTGGYVEFTIMILPFFGLAFMVILLSPSGKILRSDETKSAFSLLDSFFARSSDAFPPITVTDNKSTN